MCPLCLFVARVFLRRSCFLVLEHVASFDDSGRIDRHVSFVNMPDDAFFIDQEGGAISEALFLVVNAVILNDGAFEIAENWECNSELFCEFAVGGNAVDTHSEDLSLVGFEFGDISLIRLQLLRSTAGKGEHVDRQYDIFLTFEIAQLVLLSVRGAKREVRSFISDLQVCFWWNCLLGQCRNAQHGQQRNRCQQFCVHVLVSFVSRQVCSASRNLFTKLRRVKINCPNTCGRKIICCASNG